MEHIDIIIPTRNRLEKLLRCLKTIPQSVNGMPMSITVICDGDPVTAQYLRATLNGVNVICVEKHSGSVYCRNLMAQTAEDALLYATDDIEFKPGAIAEVIRTMNKWFPDGDGVVGFNQINARKFSPTGVALIGQKFLRRYPQRRLFYPGYFHFSCQEIEHLSRKLGKLKLAEKAHIMHYHPAFNKCETDKTHVEARRHKAADKQLSIERFRKGIIWGDNGN